jgi:dihydrofolate synthase / folylpolyglutamate synthase
MNYQEALIYLEELQKFGSKFGLGRIERLTELLNRPQDRYHTIHVTGTNGKGSVSSMIASVLTRAGIRTGLYVSPHLTAYTERIQIDGQVIAEEDFARYLTIIRGLAEQMVAEGEESPTQFEVLTALAFLYFAEKKVEYAVIEVGLGGLLDSTNVIMPEVSVITNVTMEHADRCGGTLEGIAHHKAGIIKDGVPVVTAAKGMPLEILRETAQEKNADIFVEGEDFHSTFVQFYGSMQQLEFSSELLGVNHERYALQLLGTHQIENSALAVMTAQLLHNLDSRITQETITQALAVASWPGRFERMDISGQHIIVDGAHNPAGMKSLRSSLDTYFPTEERVFLLGMLRDKDIDAMLPELLRPSDKVVMTTPDSDRAADPGVVAYKVHAQTVEVEANRAAALEKALAIAAAEDRLLCVAGSLYLVGEIRQLLLAKKEQAER